MKNITGYVVSASESAADLGPLELPEALSAFEEYPWTEELSKVEQTGCFPTLSFGAPDDHDSYINITPNEVGSFMTCTEAIMRPGLAGILFHKAAYRETGDASDDQVREQIEQFFDLECHELFDRIKQESRDTG